MKTRPISERHFKMKKQRGILRVVGSDLFKFVGFLAYLLFLPTYSLINVYVSVIYQVVAPWYALMFVFLAIFSTIFLVVDVIAFVDKEEETFVIYDLFVGETSRFLQEWIDSVKERAQEEV